MRESIGTSFTLNFIVLFIFLVFAFLAGTLSYYKAYRVNNYIINAIEKYEGYNEYSKAEIKKGLTAIGYDGNVVIDCDPTRVNSSSSYLSSISPELDIFISDGVRVDNVYPNEGTYAGNTSKGMGYCIYLYDNDAGVLNAGGTGLATTDVYYRYGVLTYMQLKFPVIESTIKIPIFSSTNRMYYFN